MKRVHLRQCTVTDARNYYLQGRPIRYKSPQTGGETTLPLQPTERLPNEFMLDGTLKWEDSRTNQSSIIPDWLSQNIDGPYPPGTKGNQPIFYFLGGHHSEFGHYWMQVCSDPLNMLSEDCLDSIFVWIPTY